jgi:hypothetical protein
MYDKFAPNANWSDHLHNKWGKIPSNSDLWKSLVQIRLHYKLNVPGFPDFIYETPFHTPAGNQLHLSSKTWCFTLLNYLVWVIDFMAFSTDA